MNQELFDWIQLLGRWLHITVAVAWIGNSFFFMWLDRSFQKNESSPHPGHIGDLWMVHGGGFYHVEKLKMGPTKVPEILHWFKWESYWTWMSGIFLLALIFYASNGTFLLDSSVSRITYGQALLICFVTIVGSWFFYDLLWESRFSKTKPLIAHTLTIVWFAGVSYFLCHVLSGRAAYIHIGAMLGTWMTANVFLRIIPRQVKMVEASKKGEEVNQEWSINAKNRSTHNTYFTLPVIFIMLSNHFPSTYGNRYNWIILLVISAAGAAIREYFVKRIHHPKRAISFGALGLVLILGVVFLTQENTSHSSPKNRETTGSSFVIDPLAGQLKGTVSFEGTPPPQERLSLPISCTQGFDGEIYSNSVLIKEGKIKNALVRITKGLEGKSFTDIPEQPVLLDQKHCIYEPRVIAARVGQKIEISNSDPTFHNVKSLSKNNDNFNIAMPEKDQKIIRVFDHPEITVETKCSVHPWMSASIAIMDHPFFAITDEQGRFVINHIPPGTYTIEFWHEVFGSKTQEIILKEKQSIEINQSFTAKGAL